ncbi:MAG: ATP synthase F1 subunit gamma [Lachnospiraceae bacterium]|nr:ATP synthase F1 subunit gamma [Lachnospiraceae bacterium]
MANAREIQNRIDSIRDTMKITRAMYMMSSMKLRKAKQKLENTEPYFTSLQEQIKDILYHYPDMQHLYFDNRNKDMKETVKKKGFVIVTGDKGMAGAYNLNVLKKARELIDQAEDYRLFVVGELGRQFFKSQGYPVEEKFVYSANNPSIHRARMMTEYIIDLYQKEELDEVYIILTRMVNSLSEEAEIHRLLPLQTHKFLEEEMLEKIQNEEGGIDQNEARKLHDDWYLIYPSPTEVLEKLVYNYVTGFFYGALVEASACEENARMLAMQSATNNAEAMLHDLSIEYNRVRQAAITQEITEVIGGAKALKKKKQKQER